MKKKYWNTASGFEKSALWTATFLQLTRLE